MRTHFLTVTPIGPLHLGTIKPRFQFLATRDYIPGSVLRGALAQWLLVQNRSDEIVPTVSRMRFGNLFPTSSPQLVSLPLPLTALQCKAWPGFRESSGEAGAHGVCDSLLTALAYAELERAGAVLPVPYVLRCPECGSRLDRASGFYTCEKNYRRVEPRRTVQTKVALSRHRGAAQKEMMYRVTAVAPTDAFVGFVWASEEDAGLLVQVLTSLGLGGLTSRGYGEVEARLQEEVRWMPVEQRVREFNEGLKHVWKEMSSLDMSGQAPTEPQELYFSVDLVGPGILVDRDGCPTLKLELAAWGRDLAPVFWATRPDFASGWSAAWGLRKPSSLCAAMGSAYVYSLQDMPETVLAEFEALEERGVGERTGEGFGQVVVCHPFHKEAMPV